MIHDNVKEEIKHRSDIGEVIGHYIQLKRAGNRLKALCPFHNEKTPSFTVNPDSQSFYCFGCQKGGDVFSFIMEYEGVDFPGAMRLLGEQVGVEVPEFRPGDAKSGKGSSSSNKDVLYKIHEKLTAWYQEQLHTDAGKIALDYCHDRGLSDEIIREFKIGYAPDSFDAVKSWGGDQGFSWEMLLKSGVLTRKDDQSPIERSYDRFRHRLMFPIMNPQGRVVGFSGRVLDAEQKGGKYVNSPETPIFHKGGVLYGLAQAREHIRKEKCCLLCEGQMDVIACHASGINYAVAPQGTAFTESQARLIKRYTENLIICFDADTAGINATLKSADAFIPVELNSKVMALGEGEDPDSLVKSQGAEALQEKVRDAEDYFSFLLDVERKRHDEKSPAGKKKIIRAFLQPVSQLNSPVVRGEYCQMVADRLKVQPNLVFAELNAMINRRRRGSRYNRQREEKQADDKMTASFQAKEPKLIEENEGELLDLCLHHEHFAQLLHEDLPVEYISDSPVGRALNDLIAYTAHGEWDLTREMFMGQQSFYECERLNKALVEPLFGPDCEEKKADLCYRDCLGNIMSYNLQRSRKQLEKEIKTIEDEEIRREKRREYFEICNQEKKYKSNRGSG